VISGGSYLKQDDELALLVERCKLHSGDKAFVRCVSLAPEPVVILSTNFQLTEIKRCCTIHNNAAILSIDPTFDLGNFYVTPMCFLHPMFVSRDTGKNPLFIGPILIHKRMNFQAYHFFASQLVNLCPDINHLKCFGTDGEKALYQAFASVFPLAVHLRWFNHFKVNVEDKLKDLNFEEHSIKSIMADIMGCISSGVRELGLVDADDRNDFIAKLNSLEER
jgi:hypothetical protein